MRTWLTCLTLTLTGAFGADCDQHDGHVRGHAGLQLDRAGQCVQRGAEPRHAAQRQQPCDSPNYAEWYNLYDEANACEPQFNEYSRLIRDMVSGYLYMAPHLLIAPLADTCPYVSMWVQLRILH